MLTANDIGDDGSVTFESARRTSHSAFAALTDKCRPQAGDVLVTKDGSLGRVALFEGEEACVNQSVAVLTPDPRHIEPALLALLLRVPAYNNALVFEAGGTTIKHLYITRIVKQQLALPPVEERPALIGRLQAVLTRAATSTGLIADQIDLLAEHRQALITAAVTGEFAVPGAA